MITFDGCLKNLSGILAKASDSANPKLMRTSSGSASLDWSTESMLENDEVLSVVVLCTPHLDTEASLLREVLVSEWCNPPLSPRPGLLLFLLKRS